MQGKDEHVVVYDVAVIGGGPSGLMAAIASAEQGTRTILIEKGRKLGNKLAISGGGRCNVTNRLPEEEVIKNIPGNGVFLYSAFSVFNNYDIIDYFEEMGVALKEEDHGRMFPVSNSAKSVVDTLIRKLEELNVTIMLDTPVDTVHFHDDIHTIDLVSTDQVNAKSIVIAVGGKSVPHTGSTGDGYAWAKKAGHTITPLYPTEVALTSSEEFITDKRLQGLSLRDVALSVLDEKGKRMITHQMDMIFTHFGISGPAVLRCSQFVVKERMKGCETVEMHLDLFPQINIQQMERKITEQLEQSPRKTCKNILKEFIPERFVHFLLHRHAIADDIKGGNVSKVAIRNLAADLKGFTFEVDGSLSIEKAFVTGGGVATKEIAPHTMASKKQDRLFFCGEILDIHGYTGGYNITSALVTGRLAGTNAAYASY